MSHMAWAVLHHLAWPLRLALSVLVTLNVLRIKRDIGSAIGWIGLVWLAPITGAILYAMFGINRVRRLAKRLSRGRQWSNRHGVSTRERLPGDEYRLLSEAVGRLTGRALLGGNAMDRYQDGDSAYPVMLEAIAGARSTIVLSSYLFHDDAVGSRFVDAIVAAAARGVGARVMVDGVGSGYLRCRAAERLRAGGVPTARFMHSVLPWRMPFINLRSHKKVLVVDGRIGFAGGMNIAADNMLALHPRHPVSDTHFRLRGPIVHQLSEAFARDWSFSTGQELDQSFFPEQAELEGEEEQGGGDALMRVVTSGPDTDIEKIEFTMMQAIATAQRSIRIMTPYFLPDERLLTVLAMSAMRGVEIDIVMPLASNQRPVDWARDANNGPLLDAGVRLWLARPPFNHSKLMTMDGSWALIGSSNLDVRSLRLNFELNVEVYDEVATAAIEALICEHRHLRQTQDDLDRRGFLHRLRDSGARLMLPYL